MLAKDSSVSIHHRNIQSLEEVVMCKFKNELFPELMNEIFQLREYNHYNLYETSQFIVLHFHSVFNGSKSVSFLGIKIWELIPFGIKQVSSLLVVKKKIKRWKAEECP